VQATRLSTKPAPGQVKIRFVVTVEKLVFHGIYPGAFAAAGEIPGYRVNSVSVVPLGASQLILPLARPAGNFPAILKIEEMV